MRITTTFSILLLLAVPVFAGDPHAGHDEHAGHDMSAGHDEHAQHRAQLDAPITSEHVSGLSIPEVQVLTQDGRQVAFGDLVGDGVVAMNFVFTTCTTICPPMGAHFGQLRQLLGERAGDGVRLISVSVDPVTDTPERLRAWGDLFGAGDGPGWTLVTGSKSDITHLLKGLQVFTPDIRDHSATVIVGDAGAGEWTRTYGLAPPAKLMEILEQYAPADEKGSDS